MAEHQVKLPSLKETSGDEDAGEEATVSFVYVSEGDGVDEGDDLVEMVTDKSTFDVPSPKSGTVKSIAVEEDQDVKVGDLLLTLEVEG